MLSDERIEEIAEGYVSIMELTPIDITKAIKQALTESTPLIRKQVIDEVADLADERSHNYSPSYGYALKDFSNRLRAMSDLPDKEPSND